MSAEDWDKTPSTTNTGEAKHHWTNSCTGIKLSLVEAIETCTSILILYWARKVDKEVAHEIETSLKSGVLLNEQNETYHRMARSSQCQSSAMCKAHKSNELYEEHTRIESEIKAAKEAWKQVVAQLKTLSAELKSMKESSMLLPGRDNQPGPIELQIEEFFPVPSLTFDMCFPVAIPNHSYFTTVSLNLGPMELRTEESIPSIPPSTLDTYFTPSIPNFTTVSLSFPAILPSMPDMYFTLLTSSYFSTSNGVGAMDWDPNLVRFGHFGSFNSSTPGIGKPGAHNFSFLDEFSTLTSSGTTTTLPLYSHGPFDGHTMPFDPTVFDHTIYFLNDLTGIPEHTLFNNSPSPDHPTLPPVPVSSPPSSIPDPVTVHTIQPKKLGQGMKLTR
ncbi:hypothetical protein B0H10DRAFT_1951617 [Mycena sp. CBHHK59/15]|nr:hypothetical protein B0H10DRAFT_1951617 [Mycena sp. CBHHK59/15]